MLHISAVLLSSSVNVNIFIAFLAGLASFLSPCVLPLVPGYLSYMSGLSVVELKSGEMRTAQTGRVVVASLAFVLGMSLTLVAVFSVINTLLNNVLDEYRSEINIVLGLVVIVLGLHMAGLLRIGLLLREKRFLPNADKVRGPVGAFVMGAAFAFGWTPCIGPALAAIIGLAYDQNSALNGIFLMIIYVLGLGVPFLVAGVAMNRFLSFSMRLRNHFRLVEIASGGLLVLIGLLIMSGRFTEIAAFVGRLFPASGGL